MMSPERHSRRSAADAPLLRSLATIDRAPDCTRAVMTRLGYRRGPASMLTARRRRRMAARAAFVVLFACIVMSAVQIEGRHQDVRTPAETSLVDAVGRDLRAREAEFIGSVRLIRDLVAPGRDGGYVVHTSSAQDRADADASRPGSPESPESWPAPRAPIGFLRIGLPGGPVFGPEWEHRDDVPFLPMDEPVTEVIERSGLGPVARTRSFRQDAC